MNGRRLPKQTKSGRFRLPVSPLTDERADIYLDFLRRTGLHYAAALAAGTTKYQVDKFAKENAEFKEAQEHALQEFYDSLEQEAHRRATEGVDEPIIGGKDRDVIVTTVRRYSDGLLTTLLKRHRPQEFRENIKADVNVSGGVLVVPGRPMTNEEWQKQFGDKARGGSK